MINDMVEGDAPLEPHGHSYDANWLPLLFYDTTNLNSAV